MKLTNKRLKHLAKRGKASIAEQRELAARVLRAERPRPQRRMQVMWDMQADAVHDYVRGSTVVRLSAAPYTVEIIRQESAGLRIEHTFSDELVMLRLPQNAMLEQIRHMARELGEKLFSDRHVPRSNLLVRLLTVPPNTPETGR